MKKFYTVYFSNTPVDQFQGFTTTNSIHSDNLRQRGKYSLTWELLDNPTTHKFLTSYENIINHTGYFAFWNRYDHGAGLDIDPNIIEELNKNVRRGAEIFTKPKIDLALQVFDNDTDEEALDKLNAIHYVFEKKLLEIRDRYDLEDRLEMITVCESLNELVHSLEGKYHARVQKGLDDQKPMKLFNVIRLASEDRDAELNCIAEDSDYENFIAATNDGNLYSDFYTVGKDLGTAFHTNDKELVRNREVKQQSLITASVQFSFQHTTFGKETEIDQSLYDRYYAWCEEAEAEKYGYNYREPKYNLGRCRIGKLLIDDFSYIDNMLRTRPYVAGVKIHN